MDELDLSGTMTLSFRAKISKEPAFPKSSVGTCLYKKSLVSRSFSGYNVLKYGKTPGKILHE
jgi:hypothetical protein